VSKFSGQASINGIAHEGHAQSHHTQ